MYCTVLYCTVLVIREVERSDAASYSCRAENIVAVRDSGVARLSVHSE